MKKIMSMTAALLVSLLLTAGIAFAHGDVEDRQFRQRERIFAGLRSGQITEDEFARLDEEQYEIETYRRHAISDGYLSRGEERRLHRMLDRAEGNIYEAKHNHYASVHFYWYRPPRYDYYHRRDYWRRHYPHGYYRPHPPKHRRHWDSPGRYGRDPYYRPPRRHRPHGRIIFEIRQPGFGMGWSIGTK